MTEQVGADPALVARARRPISLPNYIPGAIIATLLFFPTGIAAFAKIAESKRLLKTGERRAARAANDRAREFVWYSIGIGLTILAALFVVALLTLNGGAVRHAFFSGDNLHFVEILKAFKTNISAFMLTEVFVLVWALVIAVLRGLPGPAAAPVRFLMVSYTDIFRGLPAIIVIYIAEYGFKRAGLPVVKNFSGYQSGVLALTLVYGAYVAEVYRSGIESIHWSQVAAARSLGLSWSRTMRYVIVPQAVRRIIPPLLNDFIGLQKDTALVSTLGVVEALQQSQIDEAASFNGTYYLVAATLFVALTIPLARLTDWLVARDRRRQQAGRLA